LLDVDGVEVQQRSAEHHGNGFGNFQCADFARLAELGNERGLACGGFLGCVLGGLLRNLSCRNQGSA
jgi:hypothetical protein